MPRQRQLLIHLLFVLSGAAGLVYQVVWTRELVLVFGATVQSASVVLAAFMAGFGAGGLWGGARSLATGRHLRTYGLLELAVAVLAAAFPWTLKAAQPLFAAAVAAAPDSPGLLLLPSTFAMGATFPVLISGLGGDEPDRSVASLFAANTLGACLGVVASGFFFIGFLGLTNTAALAVAANLAAGGIALWLSRNDRGSVRSWERESERVDTLTPHPSPLLPVLCYFAAGLCGMASEVIWYRVLLPSFNNSVYGFATVLAIYLAGLSGGSVLAARLSARGSRLAETLGGALVAAGILSLAALYVFEVSQLLQMRFADLYGMGVRPLLAWPLAEAALVLLPVATLQGMMLPMVVRLLAPAPGRAGHLVGRLYAANTAGAILGALCAGFWWIPAFSVQRSLALVACVYAGLGLAVMARAGAGRRRWLMRALAAVALLLVARVWAGRQVPARVLLDWLEVHNPDIEILRYAEDAEASVAVVRRGSSAFLVINGVGVTGFTNATKMLAHLPLILHPDPRRMLVICFGMGTTWRSALTHPGVRVDAVDLVPSVLDSFPWFYRDAAQRLAEPRGRRFAGDGRGWLALRPDRYDVIVADPSPPLYSAGTVNLYNRDFFELAASRLTEQGLLAVWLPQYPEGEFVMVMKSFFEALPHAQAWKASRGTPGLILLGSRGPIRPDLKAAAARLSAGPVRRDLLELDREFADPEDLWPLYLGPKESFAAYLKDVPVVTDDKPWIEYPYFRSKRADYFRPPQVLKWAPAPLNG